MPELLGDIVGLRLGRSSAAMPARISRGAATSGITRSRLMKSRMFCTLPTLGSSIAIAIMPLRMRSGTARSCRATSGVSSAIASGSARSIGSRTSGNPSVAAIR